LRIRVGAVLLGLDAASTRGAWTRSATVPTAIASLSRRLKAGDNMTLAWSGFCDPAAPETMLRIGYDVALLDMQHGAWTYAAALAGVAAANGVGKPCLVRVPVGEFALASRLLDAGAAGVVAPMINSAADARAFADFCKFPPLGRRSWGPLRAMGALGLGPSDYLAQANQLQLAFAMIETRAALDALDEILDAPGVDGVLVGPADLSIALSDGAHVDPQAPDVEAALAKIGAACRARGKAGAAYATSGARAARMAELGFQLASVGNDQILLRQSASAELAAARGAGSAREKGA
jgi:4-hydroxy-2-oxoheptanedioate aldolase